MQNHYDVAETAKIWLIFTDWSQAKAKQDPEYPQTRIHIKEVELWGDEQTLSYIGSRIDLLEKTAGQDQSEMPKCTDEELWSSEETWAIMKEGAKRAFKVHKKEADAKAQLEGTNGNAMSKDYSIVHRPGKVARCRYCAARKFCNQHTDLVEAGRIEDHDN